MKRKTKVLISILVGAALVPAVAYAVFILWFTQAFATPVLVELQSPSAADDELWLVEQGFQDRGITLYVKSAGGNDKPEPVTDLDWPGLYQFVRLQWSQDGRFVAVVLGIDEDEVYGFAYDFSTQKAILPPWQDRNSSSEKPLADWKQHEAAILKSAQEHGGLTGATFESGEFGEKARPIWFWQVPKG